MLDPISSWLWLVDVPPGARALAATAAAAGRGDLTDALAGHFATVDVLGDADLAHPPWPPATFDCIVLYEARPDLRAARRLLKPGGWLVMSSRDTHFAAGALTRRVTRSGFRDVRRYYVAPALDHATTIIPAAARTIRAHQAFDAAQSRPSLTRRVAAFVGLHEPLFPAYLLFARA